MSAPSSPSLRSQSSVSDDVGPIGGFDGERDIRRAWVRGLTPDPQLTVSEWAEQHRWLSSRASAEPGRYRTDRTPYMRDIMDALSHGHPAQRIVFMKAAQVGATEGGNCFIGYAIHHAPGPMLAVQPTVELAKRNSRQRIEPLIEESPALRELVRPARSRDSGNTQLSKDFPGGVLIMTGANSAVGLRSMPARYVFLDEVDAYPASADEEGDPVGLAEARSLTFAHRRKLFLVSTPTIRGVSASSGSTRHRTSGATSCRAPTAGRCSGCGSSGCAGERAGLRQRHIIASTASVASPSTTRGRCWRQANGGRSPRRRTSGRSAFTCLRSTCHPAGRAGPRLRGTRRRHRDRTRPSNTVLGETWVETGEAPDWQRLAGARSGRRAPSLLAACS
jgi:hypothetical protein